MSLYHLKVSVSARPLKNHSNSNLILTMILFRDVKKIDRPERKKKYGEKVSFGFSTKLEEFRKLVIWGSCCLAIRPTPLKRLFATVL